MAGFALTLAAPPLGQHGPGREGDADRERIRQRTGTGGRGDAVLRLGVGFQGIVDRQLDRDAPG